MNIYNHLLKTIEKKGAAYLILLDPDKLNSDKFETFIKKCNDADVDGFLIGGSLMLNGDFDSFIKKVKQLTKLPAIIFPGAVDQISKHADAILYLSVVSGQKSRTFNWKTCFSCSSNQTCKLRTDFNCLYFG